MEAGGTLRWWLQLPGCELWVGWAERGRGGAGKAVDSCEVRGKTGHGLLGGGAREGGLRGPGVAVTVRADAVPGPEVGKQQGSWQGLEKASQFPAPAHWIVLILNGVKRSGSGSCADSALTSLGSVPAPPSTSCRLGHPGEVTFPHCASVSFPQK